MWENGTLIPVRGNESTSWQGKGARRAGDSWSHHPSWLLWVMLCVAPGVWPKPDRSEDTQQGEAAGWEGGCWNLGADGWLVGDLTVPTCLHEPGEKLHQAWHEKNQLLAWQILGVAQNKGQEWPNRARLPRLCLNSWMMFLPTDVYQSPKQPLVSWKFTEKGVLVLVTYLRWEEVRGEDLFWGQRNRAGTCLGWKSMGLNSSLL